MLGFVFFFAPSPDQVNQAHHCQGTVAVVGAAVVADCCRMATTFFFP
jgi:hypothetical protein